MSCTFFFPILLALFFTSYASATLHAAGRTEARDILPIAVVGVSFPGWMLIIHIGVLWLLKGVGTGLDFNARTQQMLEPTPIAITTILCALVVAGVVHLDLRDRVLTGWLVGGGLLGGAAAAAGPAGMFAAIILWHACAMTGFGVWKKREERRLRSQTTCPGCGFDIRGVSAPRCPECGHKIYRPERPETVAATDTDSAADSAASA